jgi:hypothetical protein
MYMHLQACWCILDSNLSPPPPVGKEGYHITITGQVDCTVTGEIKKCRNSGRGKRYGSWEVGKRCSEKFCFDCMVEKSGEREN